MARGLVAETTAGTGVATTDTAESPTATDAMATDESIDGPYLQVVTEAGHSFRITVSDVWLLVLLAAIASSVVLTAAQTINDGGLTA